ncbi:hypothetical protein RHIZO_05147 [Rhizobiaceae bacterium]|nr:hypothetical protein RHIZO_05147 [Rhizobiaceae bacterium]
MRPETPVPPGLPVPCRDLAFEGVSYAVCEIRTTDYDILLRRADRAGSPYKDLGRLAASEPFDLAMNAGMYHEDFSPVGLHVEDGVEQAPLNLGDAPGNFFLKPNGVFFVDADGTPGVLETNAYAAANIAPRMATQSGPMLVIDGAIHPRFEPNGESRHVRNGVGVTGKTAVFAISHGPVSLGSFARLFRDALGCANALFFDGTISALHDCERYVIGGEYPAGPIVAIKARSSERPPAQ